jgi:hypothetical protein
VALDQFDAFGVTEIDAEGFLVSSIGCDPARVTCTIVRVQPRTSLVSWGRGAT